MHIYKISYNLTVSRTAACLNNCSQHGTCTADGLCHCEGDWYRHFPPGRQHCSVLSMSHIYVLGAPQPCRSSGQSGQA